MKLVWEMVGGLRIAPAMFTLNISFVFFLVSFVGFVGVYCEESKSLCIPFVRNAGDLLTIQRYVQHNVKVIRQKSCGPMATVHAFNAFESRGIAAYRWIIAWLVWMGKWAS